VGRLPPLLPPQPVVSGVLPLPLLRLLLLAASGVPPLPPLPLLLVAVSGGRLPPLQLPLLVAGACCPADTHGAGLEAQATKWGGVSVASAGSGECAVLNALNQHQMLQL
jgi:hypothetical protein